MPTEIRTTSLPNATGGELPPAPRLWIRPALLTLAVVLSLLCCTLFLLLPPRSLNMQNIYKGF